MTDEPLVTRATEALWNNGLGPILDQATARRLALAVLEAELSSRPSLQEVVRFINRGRDPSLAWTTGSPVQFRTLDGVTCTVTFDPATPPQPEEGAPMSEPQTVYVVSNGTGGEVNSVWTERSLADDRAGALNAQAGETLAWSVVTTSLVA